MSPELSRAVWPVSRRRALSVIAGAAGLMVGPVGRSKPFQLPIYEWRGVALGAEASLRLAHPDRNAAAHASIVASTRSRGSSASSACIARTPS
jgi:hypothetical protein